MLRTHSDWPLSRDLVLVGGGHTHALVLRQWGMDPLAGGRVTLINPGPVGPYTGMLPGHIAGHYRREELDIDLVRLARHAGARLIYDRACGIDRTSRRVLLEGRSPVRYDVLSIDVGVTAGLPHLPGFAAHAHAVKPLGPFAQAWQAFVDGLAAESVPARCVVIGAGIAGLEIALAMAHRLRRGGFEATSVTLVESQPDILPDAPARTRALLLRALAGFGVTLMTGSAPRRIGPGEVHLADGRILSAGFIVSAAGAKPISWIAETGLSHTGGFIDVGPDLRTVSDQAIFAAGDCAHMTHAPRPKAGVFAVRQAPVLFNNLRAALTGGALKPYRPQADFLKLVSMGGKTALAQWHGVTIAGTALWTLKDRIDRSFMGRVSELPAKPGTPPPAVRALTDEAGLADDLCGGCGSKVGRDSLLSALGGEVQPMTAGRSRVRGDDAAIIGTGANLQLISTDHLRAFTLDPYLLARIAAIHALGDIWAVGAKPQYALLNVIMPRMSEPMQAATLAEMVAAVTSVLRAAGADLVGGHSSMGDEMTVGLTVTGRLAGKPTGLEGALPGDALLLTKPIGTGVILAAEMRGLARGLDVEAAFESMQRPLGAAAEILAPAAHAMTDVTGFGLAGHLMNILEASHVAGRLSLADIPFLPGAEDLCRSGVRSSIWPSNARLDLRISRPESPASDLLHDPQTAGGLLAAVSGEHVPGLLAVLEAAGETAALVGRIEAGEPRLIVT